jgi:hypothetical protein
MIFQAIALAKQGNVNTIPPLPCSYSGTHSGEMKLLTTTGTKIPNFC